MINQYKYYNIKTRYFFYKPDIYSICVDLSILIAFAD